MRIMIFAAGGDIGGGKTHILSLARELAKDNELRLVSFRRGAFADEAIAMGIDTAVVDSNNSVFSAVRLAFRQQKEFKPDIIHCHGAKANAMGVLVKFFRKVPVAVTVHSDPKLDYMGTRLRRYTYGNINAFALRHMDYYVAVAERMHDLLIERGFPPQSIFTIFNGLDFSGAPSSPRPRKDPREEIVVGIAARLTAVKDIPTLIRAFALAYEKDRRLRLSIAGIGEDEKSLRKLADDLGISGVCRFEGWIDDIKAYFKGVDINVLASLSETFPYSLLEGAYEHCPAIASTVGGIPSLIEHEKTGLLFAPGDVKTFSEYILRMASDEDLRQRLAEALYVKAKSDFSLERMRADQQAIYEAMIRKSSHKGRYGAVLCGAYGRGNAGDDAILSAILAELREIDADMPFYVMSRSPESTRKDFRVGSFYIFNVPSLIKNLRRTQLFVNGGGTLMQDVTSTRSLMFYLFTLVAARLSGSRIVMYGCGIGPISKSSNRRIAGRVLNRCADVITLRDSVSLDLLEQMGVTAPEVILAADPTINLDFVTGSELQSALDAEGIPRGCRMIGFCLREWQGFTDHSPVARAAEYAYEKHGLTPVFIPMETPRDINIGERIASTLRVPHCVCRSSRSVRELIGIFSAMDVVCGMRLHSLIFATAGGTPIVGISYDVKVDSFMKDSGIDRCVPLAELTAEKLCACIDRAVEAGRSGGEQTRARLKQAELRNRAAAERLINGSEGAPV